MFGRIANAVRTACLSPRLGQALFGFIITLLRAEVTNVLDVRTKTLVQLKTSTLNACRY